MFVLFACGVTFHTSNFYSYGDIEGRVNTIELRHAILQVGILEIKKRGHAMFIILSLQKG